MWWIDKPNMCPQCNHMTRKKKRYQWTHEKIEIYQNNIVNEARHAV